MKEYIVDLSGISDRGALHRQLQKALSLPAWYGGNLDALYDVLSEMTLPVRIQFINCGLLREKEPALFAKLQGLMRDIQEEYPGFSIIFEELENSGESGSLADRGQTPAQTPAGRTLIITDVHGCLDECRALLERMQFDEDEDTLINLGDTIDRGPQIFETFEYLRDLQERMGDRCVLIRGNHEQMMLDAMEHGGRDKDLWYYNSGEKTVFSFIHHKHRVQEYLAWYRKMPYYYVTPDFNCVHASLQDPDPAANSVETLIWGRDTDYEGKLVLTGHTPYRVPIYFLGQQYGRIREDVWTQLPETGMIALDTGCVYGNRLTGMIIRSDRTFLVTSVPSGIKKE